jgi:hypothetical protein
VAQDKDKRRALVNALMNLRVCKILTNYRVAAQLVGHSSRAQLLILVSYHCTTLQCGGIPVVK